MQQSPLEEIRFQAIRTVSLNAQLGPFDTFTELQAAAAREMPGTVLIPAGAGSNSGEVKNAQGVATGRWTLPYQLVRPVTLNAHSGPFDTFEELQASVSKQTPGTVLHSPNPRIDKNSGDVVDSQGNVTGKWTAN